MTNAAAMVGKDAFITEEVNRVADYVKIQGETWSARTGKGTKEVGTKVVIEKIDGVTLIVVSETHLKLPTHMSAEVTECAEYISKHEHP